MGENEIPWELNSVSFLVCIENMDVSLKAISHLSSLSSDPLFSCIITLYILILLYFPHIFLRIIFSPVLIITGILLLSLLRLGAIQRFEIESVGNIESKENSEKRKNSESKSTEAETTARFSLEESKRVECKTNTGFEPNPDFEENFVEWNVRAPLEVIYEAYEGEEEELSKLNDSNLNDKDPTRVVGIERYPSLSRYYPESDSDSDSSSDSDFPCTGDWVSPENICFRWEEDDGEGLIEISLDHERKQRDLDFHGEEDNLIEIDLSPLQNQ